MGNKTDAKSEANEQKNLAMMSCQHDISWSRDKGARCFNCGGQFALILLPTIMAARIHLIDDEDGTWATSM